MGVILLSLAFGAGVLVTDRAKDPRSAQLPRFADLASILSGRSPGARTAAYLIDKQRRTVGIDVPARRVLAKSVRPHRPGREETVASAPPPIKPITELAFLTPAFGSSFIDLPVPEFAPAPPAGVVPFVPAGWSDVVVPFAPDDGVILPEVPGPITPTMPVLPAVPEPETWTMMISGFGLLGFAVRRRRRIASAFPSRVADAA